MSKIDRHEVEEEQKQLQKSKAFLELVS